MYLYRYNILINITGYDSMNLIICEIKNDEFSPLKIIDNAISVIWVQRYNEAGEFELYLRADQELLELFSVERYILREDSYSVMITENVKLVTDEENGNYLTITGRSAESLLGRRVTERLFNYSDINVETVLRGLVSYNVGANTSSDRQIGIITMGAAAGLTDTIDNIQIFGANILEQMTAIAKTYNYGFGLRLNSAIEKLVFAVYTGTDRTFAQDNVPAVVFSPDYDNLCNTEYTNNRQNTCNVAYVAGEKVNNVQSIVSTGVAMGINRRETFVDASGKTQAGSLSTAAYNKVLTVQGQDELSKLQDVTSFSGEILLHSNFKFGVDYFMGDKVQVSNGYGINAAAYVTEITEVEDESGYYMYPTLSNWEV